MGLRRSIIPVPVLGLDTNADPKSAPMGILDVADNVYFKRKGNGPGAELRKRNGFTPRTSNAVQGGGVNGNGRKLARFNDEQVLLTTAGLYSWDTNVTKWSSNVNFGAVPACTVSAQPVSATSASVVDGLDTAAGGGYICTVYGQGVGKSARVVVQQIATGTHELDVALTFSITSGIEEIRVVALASVFMIVASFVGSASLLSKTIAYSNPTTISGEVAVTAGMSNSGNPAFWDMMRAGSNDWVLVAYRTTTPAVAITRWNSNQTNGGTGSSAITAANGIGWLTWDCSDNNAYLATLDNAAGLRLVTAAISNGAVSSTTVIDATQTATRNPVGKRSGVTNTFFTQDQSVAPSTSNGFIWRSEGGAAYIYQRGMGIIGRPFAKAGHWVLPCAYSNQEAIQAPLNGVLLDQRVVLFLDVSGVSAFTGVVLAKAFYGEAGGYLYTTSRQPTSVVDLDSNMVAMSARRAASDVVLVGSPTGGIDKARSAYLLTLNFALPSTSAPTVAGDTLYLPGGAVKGYGGSGVAEAGFHLIPEAPTLTVAAGGYGAGQIAAVEALICWSYTDDRGQRHWSAPSQATAAATTVANGVTSVVCQTYRLIERATNIVIELYLTAQNGSVFYLAGRAANDPTVDSVTIAGLTAAGITQTQIQQQPQLYTTDGTLAHEPFPPARLMAAWRGRLFMAGTEDPTALWVSNEWIVGEGISISSANVISMELEGGAITAIAEMDDRLIIFKRDSLYELVGGGPSASGDGNFDQPARITATVGTIVPESVVKTPQGLMFQSLRGIYLLPVGGGLPIRMRPPESQVEGNTITGAAVIENLEQVRFMGGNGGLIYHFGILDEQGLGRWTTMSAFFNVVDAAIFGGKFCYLTSAAVVNEENSGWDDNGSAITAQARWAWISPGNMFGDVRLWRVFPQIDAIGGTFTLNLGVEVDYVTGAVQSATFPVTAIGSPSLELRPARQDAMAYRFLLSETSTTQGFRTSGLALELGSEGQLKPVATTSRFT